MIYRLQVRNTRASRACASWGFTARSRLHARFPIRAGAHVSHGVPSFETTTRARLRARHGVPVHFCISAGLRAGARAPVMGFHLARQVHR